MAQGVERRRGDRPCGVGGRGQVAVGVIGEPGHVPRRFRRRGDASIRVDRERGDRPGRVCLGQQVLMSSSEEGKLTDGLNLISGKVLRFPKSDLKVPHIGWNNLKIEQDHPLFEGIPDNSFVYFVHSYYVDTEPENTLVSCNYGLNFSASVVNSNGNVMGTQFHPEKSGAIGLKILKNFVEMC